MASTYSNLKIELMGTGDQSGTWGTTTNTNLGTAIEEAITGTADVTFASADVTLTLTNTNTAQTARNLRLNLVGTVAAAQNLIVPAIEKQYIVNNTLAYDITVKNTTGTGVAVPAGKSTIVFNNGTNVVDAITALGSGTVLPVANGGTGQSSALVAGGVLYGASTTAAATTTIGTSGQALLSNGTSAPSFGNLGVAAGGTGVTTSTGSGSNVLSTSPTLVTPILGTPTSGTLTSCTGLPLTTGVTGQLPVGNGGTGATATTGTGSNVLSASPTLTGTPIAPTAAPGTNTTQIATTAFVTTATGTLGTMSTQNANLVAISGGTISGVGISGSTITSSTVGGLTIGTNATGTKTISTLSPTGGSDGDIWYQVL